MVHLKEANNMFWALVLEAGKRYSQTVEQSFHISMASLEIPTDPGKQNHSVSVMIGSQKSEFLICTLNNRNTTQQPLDLNFNEGEEVTFFVNGQGTVHLTGYQIEDDMEGMDMMDEMSDEEEEEEVPQLVPAKKRKTDDEDGSLKKKTKWLTPGGGDFDDSDDDSSDDSDFDPTDMLDMEAEVDDDDDDDDDFDDEDFSDVDDDDDDDDDEEIEEIPVKKTPKSDKKNKKEQPTPTMNGTNVQKKEQTPKQEKKKNKGQNETPKQVTKENTAASTPGPAGDGDQSGKKKRKKKKKNKNAEKDESQDDAKTPQTQQKQQNQTPQQKQQSQTPGKTPQGKTPQGKTPQGKTPQGKPEQSKTPKKMVLPGGIIAEDIKSGDGQVVKKGKMAHVYYVGKLQKDGKQFDSCTSGKPFRFKLGLGEVIQGWDKGVEGMKIGGKRRLTVPPQQGYGNHRSGPIPPNSTLVFEVELKNVS